jgi:putative two-component system response regulator
MFRSTRHGDAHVRPERPRCGWPRCADRDTSPWAQICAIADVFDALTSERPYRKPDAIEHVRERLQDMAGELFDERMIQCWMKITCQ